MCEGNMSHKPHAAFTSEAKTSYFGSPHMGAATQFPPIFQVSTAWVRTTNLSCTLHESCTLTIRPAVHPKIVFYVMVYSLLQYGRYFRRK